MFLVQVKLFVREQIFEIELRREGVDVGDSPNWRVDCTGVGQIAHSLIRRRRGGGSGKGKGKRIWLEGYSERITAQFM